MRSNIGNWTNCIGFLNHIAIFVNGAIIALNRDSWISFLPLHWLPFDPSLLDGHIGTLLVIMFLEHVFECLSSAISYMSPENPIWIEQARSLELRRIQKKQEMNRIKQYLAKEYDDDVVMRKEQEREAAALKVTTKYPKLFSLNPLSLGGLLILPVALSLVGMSPFLYTPLAFMYLSYMQVMKEKKDMRYTLDIITDPEIMDLVVKNQPDYINNPGKELTEWGNKMLQLMWPWIAQWVEQKVKDGIAPVLAKEKPFFIKKMNLVRCTPGPKAPRGIGVSVHDSVKDNNVIMDMDIVWVGEPEFEFQIQTAGPTITLSMTEFTFAAPMRFLCGPLVLGAPPFKTVGASCLKPPFVNFTFKINGLDVTNASAGNMKIAQAIDRAMRKVIAQKLLYPNHLIIKLERSADVNLLKAKTPAGLLYVKLVSGSDLVVMDLIASDPYAMLTVGAVTQQSTVKGATLFPEWNESFDFLVHDKRGQVLEVRLFDQDTFSNDDPMGRVEIKISELKEFQKVTQDYTLEAVETGSLKLEGLDQDVIPEHLAVEKLKDMKHWKLLNAKVVILKQSEHILEVE